MSCGSAQRSASARRIEDAAVTRFVILAVAFTKGVLSGVRHLDPLRIGPSVGGVTVVPFHHLYGRLCGYASGESSHDS